MKTAPSPRTRSGGRPRTGSPRLPTPEIVREQVVLEEHDLAPDGSFAIVTRRAIVRDEYRSHLWLVPVPAAGDGGNRLPEPRQLTRGAVRDTQPRIAPDGRRVAFTRTAVGPSDAKARLFVLDLDGGEPGPRTPASTGVSEFAWATDGRRLAYTTDAEPPRFLVGNAPEGKTPLARRIRRADWRLDEVGHRDRHAQLFVVDDREEAEPRQLTVGDAGVSGIAWRPDGNAIAFVSDRHADADLHPKTSIWAVDAPAARSRTRSPADPREILALAGPVHTPAWSPDGRWLAAVGVDDPDHLDFHPPTIHVGPADGSGPAVALAPDLDRPFGAAVDCDLHGWMTEARPGPIWDGPDGIVALISDRGRTHPWRFPVDPATGRAGGDPVRLAGSDAACRTVAIGGGRVTTLATLDTRPVELYVLEAAADGGTGRLAPLTDMGSTWMRDLAWPEMRVVEAPGPGGPIETFIASPAGAGDGPLPTIVDVHGGPIGAWAPTPALEVVLLCAAGYRVVLPNIRGSTTYGADWIRPQLGHWGEVDADDVHAALDHVIALGLADPERLGVLGLSYGGFMVNWLVGTTNRFKAAVSENGVTNQVSAWAHCDVGPDYCRTALMGDPTTPEGVEKLWRQSPLRHVANIRTPLLMLQAEADRRCPPADNEQLFVALRHLGREVEYVLYPDEFHVYATTGRPDRRVDRMTRVLDWFGRHLGEP
jgi:dipeptidyl aminopeptidase/acylaminoacyl peptidase